MGACGLAWGGCLALCLEAMVEWASRMLGGRGQLQCGLTIHCSPVGLARLRGVRGVNIRAVARQPILSFCICMMYRFRKDALEW